MLRELSNNGTWSVAEDYIYRDGLLLTGVLGDGQVRHFALDHLGTPRLVTNVNGTQTGYHAYYPFGEEATPFDATIDRMQFTGHERDLNSMTGANPFADDLDYMHARFYNPQLGRFTGVDPIQGTLRAPQTWNGYSYVANRPLLYTDPAGLFAMPVHYFPPTGMTLEDYGYGEGISVGSRGTATLFTDTGMTLLLNGVSFRQGIELATFDDGRLRLSDFDWRRMLYLSGQGLGAFIDGVIPFADPLADSGKVNMNEVGVEASKKVGEITRDVELALATTGSRTLFGMGRWINSGRYLRIGHSIQLRKGASNLVWFSMRGQWVNSVSRFFVAGSKTAHWNLWIVSSF